MRQILCSLLLLISFLPLSRAEALYTFHYPETNQLADAIDASLKASGTIQKPEDLGSLNVKAIESAYLNLPRGSNVPGASHDLVEDLVELKYSLIHWRRYVGDRLTQLAVNGTPEMFLSSVKAAQDLRATLALYRNFEVLTERYRTLRRSEPRRAEIERELANLSALSSSAVEWLVNERHLNLGEPLRAQTLKLAGGVYDGPGRGPKFKVIEPEPEWQEFSKWSETADFSNYQFIQGGAKDAVLFRGVEFRPGDVLLIEQNMFIDTGVNTCFSRPRSMFSHMGIFVVLHAKGRAYPAILEVFAKGLRVIPLRVYTDHYFTHYSEVLRFNDPVDPVRLERAVLKMLAEQWRYDFNAIEVGKASPRCANCSNLPSHVLLAIGRDPIKARSDVDPGIIPLLRHVGLNFSKYLTPTDYRYSPELSMVGVIDNNEMESVLSRELIVGNSSVPGTVADYIANYKFDTNRLPYMYRIKRDAVDTIRRNGYGTSIDLYFAGFEKENLPDAPPRALALILTLGDQVQTAMRTLRVDIFPGIARAADNRPSPGTRTLLERYDRAERYSIHEIENLPEVRDTVEPLISEIRKWVSRR